MIASSECTRGACAAVERVEGETYRGQAVCPAETARSGGLDVGGAVVVDRQDVMLSLTESVLKACSEILYEDETFPHRELAALLASKIHFHLEQYDDALR